MDLEDGEVKAAVAERNIAKLLLHDQLIATRKSGNAFKGFREPDITFLPSYKYDPGTDTFDTSEKKRTPAYCDRVMYFHAAEQHVRNLQYTCVNEVRVSDHKPVRSIFSLDVS